MKAYLLRVCCVFLLSIIGQSISAQEVEQVEFLSDVFEVKKPQTRNISFLNPYPQVFDQIQLYKVDQDHFLRVYYKRKNEQRVTDIPISLEELEKLRYELEANFIQSEVPKEEDSKKNGRLYLVSSMSLHAIPQTAILANLTRREVPFTDFAGNVIFNDYQKTQFGLALPIFAAAGTLAGSLLLTKDKYIPPAAANMHFFGSLMGYGHGAFLSVMIKGDDIFWDFNDPKYTMESILIPGISLVEGWLFYHLAKKRKFTYTQSVFYNSGNFWGGLAGLNTNLAYKGENIYDDASGLAFYTLAGSLGGVWLADALFRKHPRFTGDLRAINTAGFIGLMSGALLTYDSYYYRTEALGMLIGSSLGLSLSYLATKNTNLSRKQGNLVTLSSIGGFGLGIGLGVLSYNTPEFFLFMGAAGATMGWIGGFLIAKQKKSSLFRSGKSDIGDNLRFNLNPAGLTVFMSSPEQQMRMMQQNMQMNMVNLQYSF